MWKVWGKWHFGPRFWKVREFYDSDQSTDNLQRGGGGGDSEGGGGKGGKKTSGREAKQWMAKGEYEISLN